MVSQGLVVLLNYGLHLVRMRHGVLAATACHGTAILLIAVPYMA
ncbi:hypothetical protein EMIT0357P_20238 [Pseudomonas marginalis]|jgi:hypothetical protein|nr:hypothetical protein SAMN03159437_02369 [Pseudomonas sp. NFACC25]